MVSTIYRLLRRSPARYLYHRVKSLYVRRGQSDEALIVSRLAVDCPKTFVEFGFHPTEYNCIGLSGFSGLLVDGDRDTVRLARAILPKRIDVVHQFLTLDNLDMVATRFDELGVLSIDVDGNDYWFAEALLSARPHVLVVEYNASFGLESITVPYAADFDRRRMHPKGWYHGASITAIAKLCRLHDMKLVAVSGAGGNAFFVRRDSALPELDPRVAYRESALRNRWSGIRAAEQWLTLKDMPFVVV